MDLFGKQKGATLYDMLAKKVYKSGIHDFDGNQLFSHACSSGSLL